MGDAPAPSARRSTGDAKMAVTKKVAKKIAKKAVKKAAAKKAKKKAA